ncbi:hypothetical protein [Pseudoalteromonas mariniglutinosa]|uniref:hypothetical protein n=1 Tax=Pseudoalteromonas mariniglutinosa TaxID=206042 RepID=UPI00384ADC74
MQGIVYFGLQSLNPTGWGVPNDINNDIEQLKNIVDIVNTSLHSKVKVPHNWYDEPCLPVGFWEKLETVCAGDQGLIGALSQQLYDSALNDCIDNQASFECVSQNVENNNPCHVQKEFYGVLKLGTDWKGISPEYHIKSDIDMYQLALMILRERPVDEFSYSALCKKVFSNLTFHEEFDDTLKTHGATSKESQYTSPSITGINGFSRSITNSLKALNDIQLDDKSTKAILAEIAATAGFDCTPQGSDKKQLKFSFNLDGKVVEINCEFHIKISKNNSDDGVFYQDRIYFGFYTSNVRRQIFVAHSGCHL